MKPKVGVIKTSEPRDVMKGIELIGGLRSYIASGDRVLIKPNFCTRRDKHKLINTQAEMLEEVIKNVLKITNHVIVGEGAGYDISRKNDTLLIFKKFGVKDLIRKYKRVSLVDFNKTKPLKIEVKNPLANKFVYISKVALKCNKIISLARMKTHSYTVITGSLKNMMGVIPNIYKLTMHRDRPGTISPEKSIVDLCSVVKPNLCIIDGTTGMEGSGPCEGRKVTPNVILIGNDPVATDSVQAFLMGYNPYTIPLIKLAHERKIGNMKLDEIELLGEPLENVSIRFEVNAKDRIKNKCLHYYFKVFSKCALWVGRKRGIYKK